MKKQFILLALFFLTVSASYAQQLTCCSDPKSINWMVAFVNDRSFIVAHESPLPFNYTEQAGKTISFTTADGKNANAYLIKSVTPTINYRFVFHV